MNVHVIHVTKYSAAIGSRQTNSSSFHPRSVDPSDNMSECSVVAIPFAVAIPFGNRIKSPNITNSNIFCLSSVDYEKWEMKMTEHWTVP